MAAYRSYHGATAGVDRPDRRSTALAERARHPGRRPRTGARTSTGRRSTPTTEAGGVRARAAAPARRPHGRGAAHGRRDHARDRGRHQRHPRAARRATSRASASICDEFGIVMIADEVMAGFGRCGEWFAVDRLGRHARPHHVRQGRQLRLRPARRRDHLRGRSRRPFDQRAFPGGLTYSGHPLACASAVASINIFEDEGIIEHARALGDDVIGPGLRELAERHPSVGEVRGLGVFWALELVRDRQTREPLVPYNAAGAAAKPMTEFAAACKAAGLWPFTHFNRTHVVPPCTTTRGRGARGPGHPRRGARGRGQPLHRRRRLRT